MDEESFKPGVFYFRRALRQSATHQEAIEIGLVVIRELERTRLWLRDSDLPIPKWEVHPDEAIANGWAAVDTALVDCPTSRKRAKPKRAARSLAC